MECNTIKRFKFVIIMKVLIKKCCNARVQNITVQSLKIFCIIVLPWALGGGGGGRGGYYKKVYYLVLLSGGGPQKEILPVPSPKKALGGLEIKTSLLTVSGEVA